MNINEKKKISDELEAYSSHQRCYLFIGSDVTEDMLTDDICSIKWSAVICEMKNESFLYKFSNDKREVHVADSLSSIVPNKKKMPYIMLRSMFKECDFDDEDELKDILSNCNRDVIKHIMKSLDRIYVIGYNSENLKYTSFDRNYCHNSVFFFNATGLSEDKKKNLTENSGFIFYDEFFGDILTYKTHNIDNLYDENGDSENIIYINNNVCSIPDIDLINTEGFVNLATRYALEANIPYGKSLQKKAFCKFLEQSSSDSPQWYGYAPNSDFAVKRSFEYGLEYVTKCALKREKMPNGKFYNQNNPIVLMGPPASSKTIALSALAYKIFMERKYPVLYINASDKKFVLDNERFDHLAELMYKIEQLDSNPSTILLIWDCSSYVNNTFENVKSMLIDRLINRGRRFVAVLSSYEHKDGRGESKESYFSWNGKRYENSTENKFSETTNLLCTNSYWIVNATRKINSREKVDIKNKFKSLADIAPSKEWWETFEQNTDSDDVFSYFFYLTNIIRDDLTASLHDERISFSDYHSKKIKQIFKKKQNSLNTIGNLYSDFLSALNLEVDNTAEEEKKEEEYPEKALNDFQNCVAIFSQFSLKTPRTLAFYMLCQNSSSEHSYYFTDDFTRELSEFVETSIPWIKYLEVDGDYYFSFRNTEEAKLFVREHYFNNQNCSLDEYIDFILFIFDIYIKNSKEIGAPDPTIINALTELIREISPNSRHQFDDISRDFKNYIKNHLDRIIEKMKELVDSGYDCGYSITLNMITFRREYCNQLYITLENADITTEERKKHYETILSELRDTIVICDRVLKNSTLNGTLNLLSLNQQCQIKNERALCNSRTYLYQQKYKDLCRDNGFAPEQQWSGDSFLSDFESLFSSIESVTTLYPTNGFYYNTLFNLYKEWQDKKSDSDKLRYIGRLTSIISQIEINDVTQRGINDELGKNISFFYNHLNEIKGIGSVTIEQIINNDPKISDFRVHYDKAIEDGDASYIWFICYNELYGYSNGIINRTQYIEKYSEEKKNKCNKIVKFMFNDNYAIVKKDVSALNLLFKAYWISITGSEPQKVQTPENECLPTFLNKEQWENVQKICRDYYELCKNKSIQPRPFMVYVYAVSFLYTIDSTDSKARFGACRELLQEINERTFGPDRRMYAPFVLCDENGNPEIHHGRYSMIKNEYEGKIKLNDVPDFEFNFRADRIADKLVLKSQYNSTQINNDLVIAIGYTRFQIYSLEKYNAKNDERKKTNDSK